MSQENIEVVRALLPEPQTNIVPLLRDGDAWSKLRDGVSQFVTEDFQSVVVFPAETRASDGLEGFRKNWLDWLEPWETYRSSIDELIDLGERVLALLRNYGRRKDMEIEVELIGAAILTFRDGKVARWEDYADRAQALEAVGLREWAMSQEMP